MTASRERPERTLANREAFGNTKPHPKIQRLSSLVDYQKLASACVLSGRCRLSNRFPRFPLTKPRFTLGYMLGPLRGKHELAVTKMKIDKCQMIYGK